MPSGKRVRIIFLAVAILFEVFLTLASTFYLSWHSASFLVVVLSLILSSSGIIYYVLVLDQKQLAADNN